MAKNLKEVNFFVLISNPDLKKLTLLLFCHFEANFNDLKYFYRVVVGNDCKREYKTKTLKHYTL